MISYTDKLTAVHGWILQAVMAGELQRSKVEIPKISHRRKAARTDDA